MRDVDWIEGVQRKATKQLPEFNKLTYSERLNKLNLPTLCYRRARGDMIELYKLTNRDHNKTPDCFLKFQEDHSERRGNNRGNTKKIYMQKFRTNLRKNSFSVRAAKNWNSLPDNFISLKGKIP